MALLLYQVNRPHTIEKPIESPSETYTKELKEMSNNERIRLEGELIGLKARCKTMEQIIYYSEFGVTKV